jgi:hypothetical protein
VIVVSNENIVNIFNIWLKPIEDYQNWTIIQIAKGIPLRIIRRESMLRKIFYLAMLACFVALLTGCQMGTTSFKIFASQSNPTITIEETMTLYKNMDINGPIIGKANPGTYKVYNSAVAKNNMGTWALIEVNGKRGYVVGFLFKK